MVEWFKKRTGQSQLLVNPTGLSTQLLDLIRDDLFTINKKYKELGQHLLKYVIDGEAADTVLKLSGLPDASDFLGLGHRSGLSAIGKGRSAARAALFNNINAIDPAVCYRLAEVYHAAWSGKAQKQSIWPHLPKELEWLEIYLRAGLSMNEWGNITQRDMKWTAGHLVSLLKAGGHPTAGLAELILLEEPRYGYAYFTQHAFETIEGLGEYFEQHASAVIGALAHKKAQHRSYVLGYLHAKKTPVSGELLGKVIELALSSAKTVRKNAEVLIFSQKDTARQESARLLQEKLENGSAAEKTHSVGLLSKLMGDQCVPLFESVVKKQKSKKVIAEIEKYLHISTPGSDDGDDNSYEDRLKIPDAKQYPAGYEISTKTEKEFYTLIEAYNQKAVEEHKRNWDRCDPKWRQGKRIIKDPIIKSTAKLILKGLTTPKLVEQRKQPISHQRYGHLLYRELGEYLKRNDIDLVPLIRLGFLMRLIQKEILQNEYFAYHISEEVHDWICDYRKHKDPDLSLIDLGAAFKAAGLNDVWIERLYLSDKYNYKTNPLELNNDAIWPFFHQHYDCLEKALGIKGKPTHIGRYFLKDYKIRAYQILATFPRPPKRFTTPLWEQALGTSKAERPLAQRCLRNYPGRGKIIINALTDGRKDVRANAASWLMELNVTDSIAHLKKALKKEKQDIPKAAMMEALEYFGTDIDKFLNRKKLLEEARKGLKKGVPKDLAWFPFDQLPTLHWEKNRQKVPEDIVKWFMVQSFKLKKPESGPLMRRYFSLMRPDERKKLGTLVLNSWLTQDTLPRYSQEEAEQMADQETARYKQYVQQYPQHYPDWDENQTRKQYLLYYLNECMGSANSSKGILAVSAVCCDAEIVPAVERYIKFWYGRKLAQCKALIQMLSWIDHPLTIQLILSIATRFRTKGIQKEAGKYADIIAERKGWTRDEMADRTIPNAGFEPDGTQLINYGQRHFKAKLLEDFSIQLENNAGKVIKNLPAANKMEDADEIKAEKKEFSASKRELKQVLKLQKERLYESMCTERQWCYTDWEMYLNRHPIVGRYCQKIIWIVIRNKAVIGSFRPLADNTLTDYDDEPVTVEETDVIQIAHQAFLNDDASDQWQEHLSDYEVEPLFVQFGKKQFNLTGDQGKETEFKAFEGFLINSFKLRSITGKLGYTRGMAEDGGWFYTYHKTFPGLNQQAVIEFTGNVLPEEDRTVALIKLYFIAMKDDSQDDYAYFHRPINFSKIPAVMLSECWNDLKQMADIGSGFDEDWEKKSEY